jgi:quercetin dioxygenase-like cupin family protein
VKNTPVVAINCVANLFARQMMFSQAGDIEHGHTHAFDHLTLLAYGGLNVTVEGKTTEFVAPCMIYIKADKQHQLVATMDGTVAYCIHALRTGDAVEDILDPASIPLGVNPLHLSKPLM